MWWAGAGCAAGAEVRRPASTKAGMVMPRYIAQEATWSTVIFGDRFVTPVRMVVHHEVVETWAVKSKAIQLDPGSNCAVWRLPIP